MTTGRINQVTTFRPCNPEAATHDSHDPRKGSLSRSGVHQCGRRFNNDPQKVLHTLLKAKVKPPCSPVSQILDTHLPVTGATEIMAFKEDY